MPGELMSILSSPERAHSPQSEHRGAATGAATVLADDGTGGGTARAGPHTRVAPAAPLVPQARPVVAGKFLFAGGEKLRPQADAPVVVGYLDAVSRVVAYVDRLVHGGAELPRA